MRRLCIRLSLALLWLAVAGGCAADPPAAVSLDSWRQSVERYVWDQGNGDPNVLRDLTWDNIHRGFAELGDPLPQHSTDAVGVLVGHRPIEGREYFIFLVGLVREGELLDLRPVALNVAAGSFHWLVGSGEPSSLAIYRQAAGPSPPPAPQTFPAPSDTFRLNIDANRITIRHEQSAARWILALPARGPATQTSFRSGASSVAIRCRF